MMADLNSIGEVQRRLELGQCFVLGASDFCSLVLALRRDLAETRFELPLFAATAISLRVVARRGPDVEY